MTSNTTIELAEHIAEQFSFDTIVEAMIQNYFKLTPPAGLTKYTFSELGNAAVSAYNKQLDDYNELVDILEQRDKTIADQELKLASNYQARLASADVETKAKEAERRADKLMIEANTRATQATNKLEQATKNEQAAKAKATQATKALTKEQNDHATTKKALKREKTRADRLKEKNLQLVNASVPNAKKKIAALIDATNTLKAELAVYERSESSTTMASYVGSYHNLYTNGKQQILFLDKPLDIEMKTGERRKQYTLIYTESRGTYYTYCLGEPAISEVDPVFFLSERIPTNDVRAEDADIISKYDISIPEYLAEAMGKWLVKVNITQKGELQPEDYEIQAKKNLNGPLNLAAIKKVKSAKKATASIH